MYEDGHYYIFPIYETKQDLNFVKINEKTGEVVYDNIFHQNIDVYAFNPRYFKRNGNLVYLHGRYIFQLDLNNGKVIKIGSELQFEVSVEHKRHTVSAIVTKTQFYNPARKTSNPTKS